MSSLEQQPAGDGQGAQTGGVGPPLAQGEGAFYQRTDWLSFGVTACIALAVYWYTLAPEVTLANSGILATAAKYGGVAHPPGFPGWTLYAWLFTKLLPWSNIAWRVAVSSAVAGAVACGIIALIVSRIGAMILDGMRGFKRMAARDEQILFLAAGTVAGLGFGFSTPFWGMAVIGETSALSVALFGTVLCLLVRWLYTPDLLKYLYTAFFLYGIAVSASQVLIPAALGLPFFVMFGDRELGRELFFTAAVLAECILVANHLGWLPTLDGPTGQLSAVGRLYLWIGLLAAAMCLGLIFKTRGAFTRVRPAVTAGILALLGTFPHLELPLASMTNPPSNWGYARTIEGLVHVLTRGQFERISATDSFTRFLEQVWDYTRITAHNFGIAYMLLAIVPFFFLRRMRPRERGVMLGLLVFCFCTFLIMLYLLNPPKDVAASRLIGGFFPPSHLCISLWTGPGLVIVGTLLCRPRNPNLD